jgi:NAD(P)-dependent dehydrogenase (short-subunit alcohol dehydrogenase family)
MGYFRLTHLLLDLLARSAPARIVNVASDAHRFARLDFTDLQNEKKYVPLLAYAQSKLANVLFTRELARRLDGSGVTVNAMHPGTVNSNFYSNATGANKIVFSLFGWTYRSPEKGAETVLHLATAPELEHATGGYFRNRRRVQPSASARDSALARQLWETSMRLA